MALNPRIEAIPKAVANSGNPNERIQRYLSSLQEVAEFEPILQHRGPVGDGGDEAEQGSRRNQTAGFSTEVRAAREHPTDTFIRTRRVPSPQGVSRTTFQLEDEITQRLLERKMRRREKAAIVKPRPLSPPPLTSKWGRTREQPTRPPTLDVEAAASNDEWWDKYSRERKRARLAPSDMTDGGARVVEDIQESEERTVKRRGRPKAIDQLMSYKPANVFTSRITLPPMKSTGLFGRGKASDSSALNIARSGDHSARSQLASMLAETKKKTIKPTTTIPLSPLDNWQERWRPKASSRQRSHTLSPASPLPLANRPSHRHASPSDRDHRFPHLTPSGHTNSPSWPSTHLSTGNLRSFPPASGESLTARLSAGHRRAIANTNGDTAVYDNIRQVDLDRSRSNQRKHIPHPRPPFSASNGIGVTHMDATGYQLDRPFTYVDELHQDLLRIPQGHDPDLSQSRWYHPPARQIPFPSRHHWQHPMTSTPVFEHRNGQIWPANYQKHSVTTTQGAGSFDHPHDWQPRSDVEEDPRLALDSRPPPQRREYHIHQPVWAEYSVPASAQMLGQSATPRNQGGHYGRDPFTRHTLDQANELYDPHSRKHHAYDSETTQQYPGSVDYRINHATRRRDDQSSSQVFPLEFPRQEPQATPSGRQNQVQEREPYIDLKNPILVSPPDPFESPRQVYRSTAHLQARSQNYNPFATPSQALNRTRQFVIPASTSHRQQFIPQVKMEHANPVPHGWSSDTGSQW